MTPTAARPGPHTGRARAALALVAVLVALGLVWGGVARSAKAAADAQGGSTSAHTGASGTMALPVARQDYVTDTPTDPATGQPVDPYNGDPSSIHVALSNGKELARSFVWVPLSYLPDGTEATDVKARFSVTNQSEASSSGNYAIYNVNTQTAIIEACVLTSELPEDFDPAHPPAYDCADGSAVGTPDSSYDTWSFDLRDLVAYWNAHGDTGAALIPIAPSSTATFSVSFYTSLSEAEATYVPVNGATAGPPSSQSPAASAQGLASARATGTGPIATEGSGAAPGGGQTVGTPGSSGLEAAGGETGGGGSPVATTPGVSQPNRSGGLPQAIAGPGASSSLATQGGEASLGAAGAAGRLPAHPSRGGTRPWPWVLGGCLALSAVSLSAAHRKELGLVLRRLVPPFVRAFRAHPRAHTVATVAAAWGLVFASYSIVTTPSTSNGVVTAASATSTEHGPRPGGAGSLSGPSGSSRPEGFGPGASSLASSGAAGSGFLTAGSPVGGAPGSGGSASSAAPAAVAQGPSTEFSGSGTWQTIDGIRVFFPASGGPPVADLYHGADDTVGIGPTSIKICVHAALTYGPAFNISASDLNVYWDWLNAHGGIFGRQIVTTYENDNYDPGQAVQAAQACKDWGAFLLIGGIGFDQVPAVRQWAEENHELYLYTTATSQDTSGLRYSFTAQPSVEQMGEAMGELAVHQFAGKKVGIIYRNSSNWTPGVTTFEQVVRQAGMQIVGAYPVTINQGNYLSELTELRSAGAQVVLGWENALAVTEMIEQAQGQAYYPAWLIPAFNLETNTLGSASLNQPIWAAQPWDIYDPGYYGGGFAPIAPYIHEFEAQYKKYDPNANLAGDGGDLLFQTWEGWVELAKMLELCGPTCTRNKLVGLWLAGYDQTVPPNCNVNFARTADHHEGGYLFQVLHVIRDPNGRVNFVPVQRCVTIDEIG